MSETWHHPPERAVGTKLVIYWLLAGVPLLWGVYNTILQASQLFK
ncbi:MAG TPA: hypothetical protein VFA03_08480 [Acetobacteraceae bacterium]|nr:hypothetical protein [Acetobacteraceae bacterium]